jgi:predicted RNA binding protein YcfA (HicA-like mRNA interferase family)
VFLFIINIATISVLQKLIQKFHSKPSSLHFRDIEKIIFSSGYKKIHTRGSHTKYKHPAIHSDLIIPIHKKDCKNFYKKFIYTSLISDDLI